MLRRQQQSANLHDGILSTELHRPTTKQHVFRSVYRVDGPIKFTYFLDGASATLALVFVKLQTWREIQFYDYTASQKMSLIVNNFYKLELILIILAHYNYVKL